jgi:hypothetical protein
MTPIEIVKALDLVADYYNPRFGRWAYRAFDAINSTFFDGRLPRPLIQWALTPHGHCLGLTRAKFNEPYGPIITLHPSIMAPNAGQDETGPWDVDWQWFGPLYAFDVLIHESIHVAQHAIHGPDDWRESSHNCPSWIAEVNRLAPMLGLEGVHAGRNRLKRVPIPGQVTKTGKTATKVQRVDEGNVPLSAYSRFPDGVREFLGTADEYYRGEVLPCGITLDRENGSARAPGTLL